MTQSISTDTTPDAIYKLVIDRNVIEKIASLAAQKIDGIVGMRGTVLSRIQEGLGSTDKTKGVIADVVGDAGAKINLDVILEYGISAPIVFDSLKQIVSEDVKRLTGLDVVEMTVNIVDVATPDEHTDKSISNTDGGHQGRSNN